MFIGSSKYYGKIYVKVNHCIPTIVPWAKMAKNLPHYDVTYKKTKTQYFVSLQTRRLTKAFEGLDRSSTIDWRIVELESGVKLALNASFQRKIYSPTGSKHVK